MRKIYLNARFLTNIEGAYRLLGFPMQYSMHSVISLTAHLPGHEPVYFRGVPARQIAPASELLAYFALVRRSARAAKMTWIEVAEHFRFNGRDYVSYKRKGRRIARIWPVNPKMTGLYALRKLLFNRRGVSSFEDIRTVNEIVYDTFMAAAQAAGFIETDTEWESCLNSACKTESPSAIRRLFAHILLYCRPTNPETLWNLFKHEMRRRRKHDDAQSLDIYSLRHIERILLSSGSSIRACGLQHIRDSLIHDTETESMPGEIAFEDDISPSSVLFSLTHAQQDVVDEIVHAARTPKTAGNRLFFIYGKAGCGKTYTLNALIAALEKEGRRVLTTASTGIAATLLKNGRTAHSTFSLPVKQLHNRSVANVDAASAMGQLLNAVDVIIWDEISMQSRFAVECVERLLRDVASPENARKPFGGVTMVLGGDWPIFTCYSGCYSPVDY
ncbi:hypothetical protein ANCDUO_08287 [Ancylostoma duodenale]|uniref:ATP-dependent DNA helicase n=1 Tax=Ancylostoma duodenale TaxID=51022 RepID=A0A0C2DG74_9BILA|nr:hypothetical protein ANCDUO_08287 [Ancylostoma duodenale]